MPEKQTDKPTSTTKLNVAKIIFGALVIPWYKRFELFQVLSIPILGFVIIETYWFYAHETLGFKSALFSFLFYLLCSTVFAVRCHRLILTHAQPDYKLRWTKREKRYFIWLVKISLPCLVAIFFALIAINGMDITKMDVWDISTQGIFYILLIPIIYLFARLSLVFPATALDRQPTIRWAWKLSKGNGWRLALITAPFFLTLVLLTFARKDPTILSTIFTSFAIYSSLPIIAVTALSLAYKELTQQHLIIIKPA